MTKQTKLVAVLSAAALLAIGASMTSMAATRGWTQEDGTWVYLDSTGDRVTDEWKKSGSQYYYLDENGEMATNMVIDDGDDVYYVDANGARVVNQWISVENDDDCDQDVDVLWYYFQSSGKAYKDKFGKSVAYGDGQTGLFCFDEDGHMYSGWLDHEGDVYYLGDENEGWAYTGWQLLDIDDNNDVINMSDDYDDQEWFYFKPSTGKAYQNSRKYINGAYYTFDDQGVMLDKWVTGTPGSTAASDSSYYVEDNGDQKTKWVYTYGPNDDDEDGDQVWWYLNSKGVAFNQDGSKSAWVSVSGTPYTGSATRFNNDSWTTKAPNSSLAGGADEYLSDVAAKVINKKTYLFNYTGAMLTGVYNLTTVYREGSSTALDGLYYFYKGSGSQEGQMQTGKATVTYDGDDYYYYFQKDGAAYINTIADGVYYGPQGYRVEAEDGNSYALVNVSGVSVKGSTTVVNGDIIVSNSGKVKKSGSVKIDGYKYSITNYEVTNIEAVD